MMDSMRSTFHRDQAGPGFECRDRVPVPAIGGTLASYVHFPTGARHLHLDLATEDSAFLMAFLTPAPDSSGLTHVLEHLVMCGSERYSCRRAFFSMLGRTLSTTMNAMTTEDCTAYHFSTPSLADYENLLSVYLDAAFFPRLDRLDFDQEGCRVEIETVGEAGETPARRGVVLSEMRGLMDEPGQQLQQALNRYLFPSTPYRFNAGGDPWLIPTLDYETLRTYHRRHYRPGNAVFLSAGSLRPEWLHTRLQELALARFPHRGSTTAPLLASFEIPPLEAPSRSVVHYPVVRAWDAAGMADTAGTTGAAGSARREPDGASMALAWRLGDTSDPVAVIRARLLARCLLEHGNAPLRKALEIPGSSAAAPASNGVQETRRRIVFQCGVHGCNPDLAGEIEARMLAAIDAAARDGFDETQVDGALAQIEREARERHDPRYPFPLKLLTRTLPAALYGGEPAAALDVSRALTSLRAEVRSPKGTAELVRRCLRDNPERVAVTAIPDPAAARRFDLEDLALLERKYGGPARRRARDRVIERSRALRRRQGLRAGESSLPKLGLDAIGPPREPPELCMLSADGASGRADGDLAAETATGSLNGAEDGLSAEATRDSGTEATGAFCGTPDDLPAGISRGSITRTAAGLPVAAAASDSHTEISHDPATEAGAEPPTEVTGSPLVWVSRGPTGGLVYARLAIDVSDFEPERLDDVGLLCEILPESGHGRLAPSETRARLAYVCDHLSAEPWILARAAPGSDASGIACPRMMVVLSARARAADEDALLEVLADAHLEAHFDRGAHEAAAKARIRRSRELARNGHLHAERTAAARLDSAAAAAERWQGPSAVAVLARATEGPGEGEAGHAGQPLEDRLYHVYRALAAAPHQLQIVRDRDSRGNGNPVWFWSAHRALKPSVPSHSGGRERHAAPWSRHHPPEPTAQSRSGDRERDTASRTGRRIPKPSPEPPAPAAHAVTRHAPAADAWIVDGPVNYCAKVYPTVMADHPDAGPLAVLAAFLGEDLLQRAVRERGGAYGAGARYCGRTCTVRMFSYRDPRLAETLRDFDRAIETLHRSPPEGHRLEEAILRAVREIDKPKAFQIAAFERYLDELQGRGAEGLQALRASVLGTGSEQLRQVAGRYLRPEQGYAGVLAGAGCEDELDRLGLLWRRLSRETRKIGR